MRAATVEIPRNPSEEGEGLGENPAPVTKGISDEDQENSSSDPSVNFKCKLLTSNAQDGRPVHDVDPQLQHSLG